MSPDKRAVLERLAAERLDTMMPNEKDVRWINANGTIFGRANAIVDAWEWSLRENGFTPTPSESSKLFLIALSQAKREAACQTR